jgi:hypothetical protein
MGCGGCMFPPFLQISSRKGVMNMIFSVLGLVAIVWAICLMVYKSNIEIEDFEITLIGIFKIKIKSNNRKKPR